MRALIATVWISACLAGCLRTTEFNCTIDGQCGTGGKCETTHFCSFADTGCSSGRRYGDFAGGDSHRCVGDEIDGGIDTPPGTCPAGYATLTGAGAHKYKKAATVEIWQTQRDRCAADGSTIYLAIPDDMGELQAIVAAGGASRVWIGINDLVTEGTYLTVKNTAPPYLPWDTANGEPNNGTGIGEDCVSGLSTGFIATDRCALTEPAVCECE